MDDQHDKRMPEVSRAELTQRAQKLLSTYRHGTDDAPAFVARDIARLPTPYAIAVTAAICKELDQYERPRFAALLLEVAQGRYRSVFDRAPD